MTALRHPRRTTLLAALAAGTLASGGFAALGSAPADAYSQIYGSGAALQNQLQNDILIPAFGLGDVTYTSTSSGAGFKEFGNGTHTLAPGEDSLAKTLSPVELDSYVGVDSGPTSTELGEAQTAAGSTSTNEIAVPVAQTPLDLLLSLPSGITLNSAQTIDLTDALASELYAGTAPAAGGYNENTWGAFLIDAGLTQTVSTTPPVGEFYDSGISGGATTIGVETRKKGAGTTLNLKQYLIYVDQESAGALTEWTGIKEDENAYGATGEWPTTATILTSGETNNTDVNEVEATDGNPGTIGYATAADAATGYTVPFTSTPKLSTDKPGPSGAGSASAAHQILYALLQDNYVPGTTGARSRPIFADPEANSTSAGTPPSTGIANIYTGSNIQVNGTNTGGVGSWVVPETPQFTFNDAGTWSGTRASDPDVYDDSGDSIAYYPLVAVAFDLSWSNFSVGNLASVANYTSDAQATTRAYLEFATSPTGQGHIADYFFAPLPSNAGNSSLANIQAVAQSAASGV